MRASGLGMGRKEARSWLFRSPVLGAAGCAVHEAIIDELAAEGGDVGVEGGEDGIHLLLGVAPVQVEGVHDVPDYRLALLELRGDRSQAAVGVEEGIEDATVEGVDI